MEPLLAGEDGSGRKISKQLSLRKEDSAKDQVPVP